jgi:hypothetical protein
MSDEMIPAIKSQPMLDHPVRDVADCYFLQEAS